jgi:thiol-disulfide isomerase/thioredoxin
MTWRIFVHYSNMDMKKFAFAAVLLMSSSLVLPAQDEVYRAVLLREDRYPIIFTVEKAAVRGKPVWYIRNAEERIRVDSIRQQGDSIWVDMPFFESRFELKALSSGAITGNWIKGTTRADQVMPVQIDKGSTRFTSNNVPNQYSIDGRWRVNFTRPTGGSRPAVAEFRQRNGKVTGTFLTPSGDYRYLEGILNGDSLQLSCFDGSHAYYFGARLSGPGTITNGIFASGAKHVETWSAGKDPQARLDETSSMMYLREGQEKLNFRFPDLDSNLVSITDPRFDNKVVVVQIMGSWCPNCMDETRFLSRYYDSNANRGLEIVALAYEYSTDYKRAQKSLRKFQQQFDVKYPMLITGVTSSDSLRTEKTLPQLTHIKAFPTTLFIGRDGKVREIHPGFYGPGTGAYHAEFRKTFQETMDRLLNE